MRRRWAALLAPARKARGRRGRARVSPASAHLRPDLRGRADRGGSLRRAPRLFDLSMKRRRPPTAPATICRILEFIRDFATEGGGGGGRSRRRPVTLLSPTGGASEDSTGSLQRVDVHPQRLPGSMPQGAGWRLGARTGGAVMTDETMPADLWEETRQAGEAWRQAQGRPGKDRQSPARCGSSRSSASRACPGRAAPGRGRARAAPPGRRPGESVGGLRRRRG